MPLAVCPNGHRIQIQDAHIGRTISCPSCQASFLATALPGSSPPSPGFAAPAGDAFADISGGNMAVAGGSAQKSSPADLANKANWFVGKPLLFLGLVLVLFGRGCDSISMRSVGRTNAQYKLALNDFMKKNMELPPDKQDKLADNKSLKQLGDDAGNAILTHQMWSYWYVWVFVFGTLLLMIGLLIVAFAAQGPERWVAYIMIAIVTFSIYVGGAAWIESIASSFIGAGNSGPTHVGPPFKN